MFRLRVSFQVRRVDLELSNQGGVDVLNQITPHGRAVKHSVSLTQLADKFNHCYITGPMLPDRRLSLRFVSCWDRQQLVSCFSYSRMLKIGFYIILLQLEQVLTEDVVSYQNYRVYEVSEKGFNIPKLVVSRAHDKFSVLSEHHEFDECKNPFTVRSYLVPEEQEKDFRQVLNTIGAKYTVSDEDLGRSIEEERKSCQKSGKKSGVDGVSDNYFSSDEICDFVRAISKIKNPTSGEPLAVVEPIGRSLEGRVMNLVKISSDHNAQKPIIFLEAGIHAREWTAPASALYTIYQLTKNYTRNTNALKNIDYYIIPLSNPDGYEYSRAKDRMWRKTRSYYRGRYGVDGNRNFDFHWGERGTSTDPESEIFRGPCPFSEIETRNIRDAGHKYEDRIIAFVSIHAYGPSIVYPWGYKKTIPAPQADVMKRIARKAVEAMEKYNGTRYKHGVSSILMYEAAGGSDDYFKGVLGVDLSFTLELSSAKKMSFVVPADEIHGIVAEAFEGYKAIADGATEYHKKMMRRE